MILVIFFKEPFPLPLKMQTFFYQIKGNYLIFFKKQKTKLK